MPNSEQLKQFILTVVVPPIAGAVATWLASTPVLAIFHITANAAATEVTQALTFAVVTAIAYLGSHHILSGHYTPAAKAAARRPGV
jgi:hypothetical protein